MLARLVGALGYEKIGVLREENGVLADSSVRAIGHDFAVQIEAVAHAWRCVDQEPALQGEGKLVRPFGKLADLNSKGQLAQRNCEWLVYDGVQNLSGALLPEDAQTLREAELVQDVKALDVVQVEVREEEIDWQVVMDVAVGLVDTVAGIEDDVVLFGVDEGADGVACVGVVPAVGAEENDLHASSPDGWSPATQPASALLSQPEGFRSARKFGEPPSHFQLHSAAGRACQVLGSC